MERTSEADERGWLQHGAHGRIRVEIVREQGIFDFSVLDEAIDVLSEEGIKVILGTPTAAPPKWLVDKYDVVERDKYGRKRNWGSRRECCANSPEYKERSAIIVDEMAKHFAGNKNVIAWRISTVQ